MLASGICLSPFLWSSPDGTILWEGPVVPVLGPLHGAIRRVVPAGVGKGHVGDNEMPATLAAVRAAEQVGPARFAGARRACQAHHERPAFFRRALLQFVQELGVAQLLPLGLLHLGAVVALWGGLLAILVLYLFLHSPRSTVIVMLAIPTARLTPTCPCSDSGCSEMVRLEPPTRTFAPPPRPSEASPLAPT